jgi:hypothetical protein
MIYPDPVLTKSTMTRASKSVKRSDSQGLSRIARKYPSSKNRMHDNGQA